MNDVAYGQSPLTQRVTRDVQDALGAYDRRIGERLDTARAAAVPSRWTFDVTIVSHTQPWNVIGENPSPDDAPVRPTRVYVYDYRHSRVVCVGEVDPLVSPRFDEPTLDDHDDEAQFVRRAIASLAAAGPPR